MVLAGANFALQYRVLRKRFNPMRDEEFRAYLLILLAASLILFLELLRAGYLLRGRDGRSAIGLPDRLDDDDDRLRKRELRGLDGV